MKKILQCVLLAAALVLGGCVPTAYATVANTANKTTVAGNGVTTAFTFTFPVRSAADLTVIYTDTTGTNTTLASSLYSVTLNPVPAGQLWATGGSVTYPLSGSAIASGTTLTIYRSVGLTQTTSLVNQGGYFPSVVERALDVGTMGAQQINEAVNRSIRAPSTDVGVVLQLPAAAARANGTLGFDSAGNVAIVNGSGVITSSPAISIQQTMAGLKALSGVTNGTIVEVAGYYAYGDGGGGLFWWNAASVVADNGGTIIASNAGGTGRWYRVYDGNALLVRWFGARCDGATDDTTAFANLIANISAGGMVVFPAATCIGTFSVTDKNGIIFQGAGRDATVLKNTGAGNTITLTGSTEIDWTVIQDMTLNGNSTAAKAITCTTCKGSVFQRLRIINHLSHGIELTGGNTLHNVIRDTRITVPAAAAAGTRNIRAILGTTLRLENNYYANTSATPIAAEVTSDSVMSVGDVCEGVTTCYQSAGKLTLIGTYMGTVTNSVVMTGNNPLVMLGVRGVDITSVDTATNGISRQYITFYGESQGQIGGGPLLNKVIAPTILAADTNNYAPTGAANAATWRISASSVINLSGISMGAALAIPDFPSGARITLTNIGSNTIMLLHESASSTDRNRFRFATTADVPLAPDQSISIYWDGTTQRWRDENLNMQGRRAAATYGATVNITAGTSEVFDITVTDANNFTIAAPTQAADGKHLTLRIINSSGGAMGVITWNGVFKMAAWTNPANATQRSITFLGNGSSWWEINRTTADVPN